MLLIKWLEGDAEGYTDLLPDCVLSPARTAVLVHNVIGPGGGGHMAKCGISQTDANVDFNYELFPAFNRHNGMELGIMRITTRAGGPEVYWKDDGKNNFISVEAEVTFEPGSLIDAVGAENIRSPFSPTETAQLINARLGQSNFRVELQKRWTGRCALTGSANDAILRASHIKPWACCLPDERLDRNNGLLLAAHVDALFDQYLITFGQEGKLIWHSSVSESDRQALALPEKLRLDLHAEEKRYLIHHKKIFGE